MKGKSVVVFVLLFSFCALSFAEESFDVEEESGSGSSETENSKDGIETNASNEPALNNKKAEIEGGKKTKSLKSNTEVSVPAGVIAKVFGTGNTSSSTPAASLMNVHQDANKDAAEKRGNFLKVKPIGKMETLEINIKGQAATKNNFTKNERPGAELEGKKSVEGKKRSSQQVQSQHNKGSRSAKKTKKSKVAFPKIILYQGPLSKEIERMLYGKMSDTKKRSEIMKILKRSQKTHQPQTKKYKVKGYVDNVKVDGAANKKKSSQTSAASRSTATNTLASDQVMKEHLNDFMKQVGSTTTTAGASGRSISGKHKLKQGGVTNKSKNKKHKLEVKDPKSLPSSEGESEESAIEDDLDETTSSSASGDEEEEEEEEEENEENEDVEPKKEDRDEEADQEKKKKKQDEKEKEDALKETEEQQQEEEDSEEGEDQETDEGSTVSSDLQGHSPNEPTPSKPVEEPPINPQDEASSPPTPPQQPSPSENTSLTVDPSNKPSLPAPVQNVPTSPENSLPTPVVNEPTAPAPGEFPEPSEPQEENGPGIGEEPSLPPSKQTPSPVEDTSYLNDDMMTQLDMNTESIDTLIARVSSLENKEKELESAMGTISEGLERIEKKLDSQRERILPGPLPATPLLPIGPSLPMLENLPKKITGGRRRPKILKEIFIPLPPRGSEAAREIEHGKLFHSPALAKLPLPIQQIISNIFRQQLRKEEATTPLGIPSILAPPPSASLEPDEPAKEHDIDKLELSLGRIPISRHGLFNTMMQQQMRRRGSSPKNSRQPKLLFFASKAPQQFFEFFSKPCEQPCQNGGQCAGHNLCRCMHGFTGSLCQHKMRRRNRPTIVEIIGPAGPFFNSLPMGPQRPHLVKLPFFPSLATSSVPMIANDEEVNNGRPHLIKLPFMPTLASDDGDISGPTAGHVDQSKLVSILRKFTMPFNLKQDFGGEENGSEESGKLISLPFKRFNIPNGDNRYNTPYSHNRNFYNSNNNINNNRF